MFPPANPAIAPMAMLNMQYQQGMLARPGPPMSNYYPPTGFGGYNSPSPAIDHFRNQAMQNGSPIQPTQQMASPMMGQNGFATQGYGMGGYGYSGMAPGMGMQNGVQNMGYLQEQQVNSRRGRVSFLSAFIVRTNLNSNDKHDDTMIFDRRAVSTAKIFVWYDFGMAMKSGQAAYSHFQLLRCRIYLDVCLEIWMDGRMGRERKMGGVDISCAWYF